MAEVRYRIHSDVELPLRMQGEMSYEQAYEMICDWNDSHYVEAMAWLVQVDAPERR